MDTVDEKSIKEEPGMETRSRGLRQVSTPPDLPSFESILQSAKARNSD
jgi:hypothetical protein